jgi:hypothetical protein
MAVLTGILLGSFLSITVSLAAVLIVFLILGDEYPRLAHEFGALVASALIFLALTAISGASFYALIRDRRSRWWWQAAMWLSVALAVLWFLPD